MAATTPETDRRWIRWAGYGLSALVIPFMLMVATMKLLRLPIVLDTTAEIGWPVDDCLRALMPYRR